MEFVDEFEFLFKGYRIVMIKTPRTILRPWRRSDLPAFAEMCTDPEVMQDYNGPIDQSESKRKMLDYASAFERIGFCRWAVEDIHGDFIGYTGVMLIPSTFPVAPSCDIGWRLVRRAWGRGLASEAAKATLKDVFLRTQISEVPSYTAAVNIRSRKVMGRLSLRRQKNLDFLTEIDGVPWQRLVWLADRSWQSATGDGE